MKSLWTWILPAPLPPMILDIGCDAGDLPSPGTIIHQEAQDPWPEALFDLILAQDTPQLSLRSCHSKLRPGGRLMVLYSGRYPALKKRLFASGFVKIRAYAPLPNFHHACYLVSLSDCAPLSCILRNALDIRHPWLSLIMNHPAVSGLAARAAPWLLNDFIVEGLRE
ncbi:MAG: hypothetical protein V2A34_02660 [Lentisphaerota bacterium]